MAYEPSWLAGQIATVYLPWLFASLLTRVRVTRFKWLELALLTFAVLLLLATVFGYFRADHATRGYYTRRLQTMAAAGVVAIIVAGTVFAQWITWL